MSSDGNAHQPPEQQPSPGPTITSSAAKKKANSYYYWHGHEKERAKVGDVAPMPTPHLVSKVESPTVAIPAVPTASVSKYSWCDGERFVSVYIDTRDGEESTLDEASIATDFAINAFNVTFSIFDSAGKRREKRISLHLSKKIDADKSSTKVKPKTQQILVKLAKRQESIWMDLEGEASDREEEADDRVQCKEDEGET